MAEPSQYKFTLKEVAEALVKRQGIHQGIWGLLVEFGFAAANTGPSKEEVYPTALVPIVKLGLQELKEETNFSVDAAKVNPEIGHSKTDQSSHPESTSHIEEG